MKKIYDITSEEKLSSTALELLRLSDNRIFTFYGEMGSGKTTCVKHLCHHLKVIDPVSSPTFSIVNEYMKEDHEKVFHFDFYRLDNIREAVQMGVEIYLNSGNYCFIEWPDLIESFLPTNYNVIKLHINNNNRELIVL